MTSQGSVDSGTEKKFTVGTLSYTKHGLWILFFWLMWNDFTLMLMEQVNQINSLILQKHGATYALIETFGSIAGMLGLWINPVFSTWSDRLRTKLGRRRPILLVSVPIFALSLMAIPMAPDFYHHVMKVDWVAFILNHIPIDGEVLFIGLAVSISGLCNAVVLAIFSYYYWDVVPENVLGRFQAVGRIVTVMAGLVWSFFIFGKAENHPKEVYIGVSIFCTLVYLVSVWRVKEGEYPPPEARAKKGPFEPVKAYVRDCYSKSFYLWIFIGMLFFQIGNKGNNYVTFYYLNDLKMSYEQIGWIKGWGSTFVTGFGLLLGFAVGSMVDRVKPIRVLPVAYLVKAAVAAAAFFVVKDKVTAVTVEIGVGIIDFVMAVASGAIVVELFPREKLGQFCSAQSFFYQTILTVLSPLLIGPFFDWIKLNKAGFMWLAFFYVIAAAIYGKVYFQWKRQREELARINPLGAG